MAGESSIAITEGSGKNLASWELTVGGTVVENQKVVLGEPFKASGVAIASAISTATSASHILQIMGSASLYTRIERVQVKQVANAGAAAMAAIQVLRVSSAGTGGSVVTIRPHDSADSIAATAMTLPSSKGTEGVQLDQIDFPLRAAIVAAEQEHVWTLPPDVKPWIVPTGTSNGIVFKIVTGVASATISIVVTVTETAYL